MRQFDDKPKIFQEAANMMSCGCTKPRMLTIMVVLLALSLLGLITTMATLGGEFYIFLPLAIFIILSSGTISFLFATSVHIIKPHLCAALIMLPPLFLVFILHCALQILLAFLKLILKLSLKLLLVNGSCLIIAGMVFVVSNTLPIILTLPVLLLIIIVTLRRLPAIQKTKENLSTHLGIALYCLDLISDEYVALELTSV